MEDDLSPMERADIEKPIVEGQLREIEAELSEILAGHADPSTTLLAVEARLINYGLQLHIRSRWSGTSPRYLKELATISDTVMLSSPGMGIQPRDVTKALDGIKATYDMLMKPKVEL